MKRAIASSSSVAFMALAVTLWPACGSGSGTIGQGKKLVVTIAAGDTGSAAKPLAVSVGQPSSFTVNVEARLPDGTVDTSFNGYINLSVQPGTVSDLSVRNEKLTNGKIDHVVVPVIGVYGQGHIWATDLGYEPAAPNRAPPPQCADGIDNNHNGLIDYPADPGCYAPVDDSEDLGSYASGVSETLFFEEPRIALVRGYDPADNGNGNATAFPHQQISVDTGWRGGTTYAFSTVVIGLTAAGFYVQDLQNDMHPGPGYSGLYAYNFSTPAFMRVCDRVQILSGTSSDFYGYTELNYPTWQLEYWNQAERPCLVPKPVDLGTHDLNSNNTLWQNEATLVRVQTIGTVNVHVASHFGPLDIPKVNGVYTPDANHSNCDFNHTGKVDFTNPEESACAAVCSGSCSLAPTDFECSEYSQYASQNDFELIVKDSSDGSQARFQVNAAAANGFNPLDAKGQTMRSFTGLLAYFSGGCQFTSNARCADDIIYCPAGQPCLQGNSGPLPSEKACVHPRTQSDINANSQ
jgi:hypothetical protein